MIIVCRYRDDISQFCKCLLMSVFTIQRRLPFDKDIEEGLNGDSRTV